MKATPFKSETTPWRIHVPAKWSKSGNRETRYFSTIAAAKNEIKKIRDARAASGDQWISADERAAINFLRGRISLDQLPAVLEHWRRTGEGAVEATSLSEAVEAYVRYVEGNDKTYSKRTGSDIRSRLRSFAKIAPHTNCHLISSSDIQEFLDSKLEGWSRKSWHKRISAFFVWAKGRRYVAISPLSNIPSPIVEWSPPEIHTPEELQKVLDVASGETLAYIALLSFGFLRTSELVRSYSTEQVLRWENIDLSENLITVPHGVAKNTKRILGNERPIPINSALASLISPLIQCEGDVIKSGLGAFYEALNSTFARVGVKKVDNGLRHSCLSYALAADAMGGGLGKIAQWAGNSEATARRHYIRSLKPRDAELWWSIRKSAGNSDLSDVSTQSLLP